MSKAKTNSNLNSLLNYRFVKKIKPKLEHDDSASSQDSDETKCPSDVQSNSQSLSDTTDNSQNQIGQGDSQSSSQASTQNYWQGDGDGTPTVISVSVIDSRLSPERDSTQKAIPVTPKSEPRSPSSPVFTSKTKASLKNFIEESDESQEPSSSSPWMSKEQGMVTNGFSKPSLKNRPRIKRALPDLTDSDSSGEEEEKPSVEDGDQIDTLKEMFPNKNTDEVRQAYIKSEKDIEKAIDTLAAEDEEVLSVEDVDQVNTLKQMFPSQNADKVRQAYINSEKDIEKAIDMLITGDITKKTVKKKRVRRVDSSDSDFSPGPPSKRACHALSSDSQDTQADSQSTIPGDVKTSKEISDDLGFLAESFPKKTRREIYSVFERTNWNVEATAEILSKLPDFSHKDAEIIASLRDGDDDYVYSGDEDVDSDDSLEEKEGNTSEREMILSFFNEAARDELTKVPGCSKKKTQIIMEERPFENWEDLGQKFLNTKGLSYDIISGCREIIRMRDVIIRLMKKCEKISDQMENVVTYLTRRNDLDDVNDQIKIRTQPKLLNDKLQLKPFQMVGLNWLRIMHNQQLNGILADEMGLGKTIQTIAFLAYLMEQGDEGPHAVIVPSSTIDNWLREMSRWCPSIKVLVYYGSQEERRAVRQSVMYSHDIEFNVILTTYNMAIGSMEDRCLFKRHQFQYAIFDEGHMLKNMASLRFQNLMKIRSDRRLLLTGTPLQNNLVELMSLLCFVMPDMFIGKTEHLKMIFSMMTKSVDDKRSKYEAERIAHAKRIIKPFMLRRLKSEVQKQIPKKTEIVERCTMIPEQEKSYQLLVSSFNKQIRQEGGFGKIKAGSSMLMQLRKAANHPLLLRTKYTDEKLREMSKILAKEPSHRERGALPNLIFDDMCIMHDYELHKLCSLYPKHIGHYALDPSVVQDSGKFRVLDELLSKFKSQGDRVLLFSQFVMMMDIMEDYLQLKEYRYLRFDGATAVTERQELIDEFTNDPDIFIFLLSTKAGGLGINLTAANVVILHDIDFNPYNDKQAEDRSHRVGQTRDVSVIRLLCKETIDEAMMRCAQVKLRLERDLADNKDDDKENPVDVACLLKEALSEGKV